MDTTDQLAGYREKRRFKDTPEPAGKSVETATGHLRFVVQKHAASQLHYDFRLELDGTLKSWAVPKGPSLNPQEKRLAIQVEDHPLDYMDFEGTIPEGNYGAGTVMVWDMGTYYADPNADCGKNQQLIRQGLRRGKLTIILDGEKLRGEFTLVRMKGKGDKSWLLIKHEDPEARQKDITEKDASVKTGHTLDEITGPEDAT